MEINRQNLMEAIGKYHQDTIIQLESVSMSLSMIRLYKPSPACIPDIYVKELIESHCSQIIRTSCLFVWCFLGRSLNPDPAILEIIDETENRGYQVQLYILEIFSVFRVHIGEKLNDILKGSEEVLGFEFFSHNLSAVVLH